MRFAKSNTKMNNSGFTLLETMICFVLLGIIVVAASQVIASNTEVYYDAKSVSYGIQISQAVATEIRGEIENAQPSYLLRKQVTSEGATEFVNNYTDDPTIIKGYYVALLDTDGDSAYETIEFIENDGKQTTFSLYKDGEINFNKSSNITYINNFSTPKVLSPSELKVFDSKYIGMGYTIKDINFSLVAKNPTSGSLGAICNCPVIKIEVTVVNDKWGEYTSTDFAALYSMYDMNDATVVYQQP